jgi:Ca2+-binding RTX toxin-like protein
MIFLGGVDEIRSSVSYSIGDNVGLIGFGIENITLLDFDNINATGNSNNNVLVGNDARNGFFGTAGDDIYDGLGGFDTIDYSALGTAVTLKSQGIIEKGALGTDTIAGMERIIGATGQINVIDGFTGGPQPTSFEIDLDGGLLLVKDIPFIGDQAFFIRNFVNVRGTSNDDVITGSSVPGTQGDNTFFGSSGNDSYDGAGGIDTIDYSDLDQQVTLKSQGVIEKFDLFNDTISTDTIAGVERIIGSLGQFNVIDGSVAGPQSTSFNINLAANNLTVNGIPGIGSASFFIQNFIDVRGTSNSDTVVGDGLSSVFFGSAGNDSYDGGESSDTIDYSSLGQRVTLKSQGVIEKDGGLGSDTIAGVERIIGTLGQANVIDGTVAGPQATSFNINLATNNLTVNGIPGIGSASFLVQNFTDVRGTSNSDTIVGNAGANSFFGGGGNDSLTGGAGDDSYGFDTDLALGSDTLNEAGGGIDTLNFSDTTTRSVAVNLGLAASQVVNAGLSLTLGSASTFENVIGGALANTLIGNALANSLTGGGGNDTLNGGGGNDTLIGGGGDDTLIGGAGNDSYGFDTDLALGSDTLNEAGGGVDTLNFSDTTTRSVAVNLGLAASQVVNAGLSLTLGSASTFENVIGGALADTITGNSRFNSLTGGGGNDTLNGGGGNDTLIGGGGDDTLIGGAGNDSYGFDTDLALGSDTLDEAGGGVDTLNFSDTTTRSVAVNLGLAASQVVNTGLSLTLGSASTFENVIGGALANTLIGNALANSLTGGGGNDTLNGGGGNDTLIGGGGADRFRFDTTLNATTNRDVISDFSIAQADTIELENAVFTALTTTGTLAASAFFIGAAATTATQRILYNSVTGNLLYDSDGTGAAGSIAFAKLTTGLVGLNNTFFTVT